MEVPRMERKVPVPISTVLGKKAIGMYAEDSPGIYRKAGGCGERGCRLTAGCTLSGEYLNRATTETYVTSLSSRTIVYKGMFLV